MVTYIKRSIGHESVQQAKETLRVLQVQKEIAEQTVQYARNRLLESVESGEISLIASMKLSSRLHHDLNRIINDVDQHNEAIQLYVLESSQVNLIQEFNNNIAGLNDDLKNIREVLKEHSQEILINPDSSQSQSVGWHLTPQLSAAIHNPQYHRFKFPLLFLVIVSLTLLSPYTTGLLSNRYMTSSTGIVASVDLAVYQDAECTRDLTTLHWGTIYPGQDIMHVIYVKNSGNVNMTLQLNTSNWNPSTASEYITINWDFPSGALLTPTIITPIQITLSVAIDIQNVQSFDFDILLTGNSIH